MKTTRGAVTALALSLAFSLATLPAQADDFIRRPDVPSSRTSAKSATAKKATPKSWQNVQNPSKVVKSTKTSNSSAQTTPPASIQ
jgi:hypothetical protein